MNERDGKKREDRFEKTTTKNISSLKARAKNLFTRLSCCLDNAPNYVPSWVHYPKEII